ncbi:MAG: hypothetical protein ACOY4I_05370 [Bacillota bacterium]
MKYPCTCPATEAAVEDKKDITGRYPPEQVNQFIKLDGSIFKIKGVSVMGDEIVIIRTMPGERSF